MQYIDGVSLSQLVKFKPLGIGKIIDIAVQISDGMMEAHAKGIIHRDIKPANIMIDRNGKIRILDFGLAKFSEAGRDEGSGPAVTISKDKKLTEKGIVMGTIHYMSPEQARGLEARRAQRHLLLRRGPVRDGGGIHPVHRQREHHHPLQPPAQRSRFRPGIPEPLKAVIRKLLAKDRKQRYAHFSEVKADLERFRTLYDHPRQGRRRNGNPEDRSGGTTAPTRGNRPDAPGFRPRRPRRRWCNG